MSNYWQDRAAKAQTAITNKSVNQIKKQLAKYYLSTTNQIIKDFETVYLKIAEQKEKGQEVTPADLYQLDSYWQMQTQLQAELKKLGNKEIKLLSSEFMINFFDVYYSINIEGETAFNTIDTAAAQQLINSIWVADGKSWSDRVWGNTELLAQTLNEELVHCVVTGKDTSQLKELLQERFNVSYNNADMIARTELAHIQTKAAEQRYKDYGLKYVEVWADEDERRCKVCGKLHQKKYLLGSEIPIPAHPRCRCCIVPVVEDEKLKTEIVTVNENKIINKFNQEITIDESIIRKQEKWQNSINIISKLSKEYDSRAVKVATGANFGGGGYNPASGILGLASTKPNVAIHEFAHSIANKWSSDIGLENQKDFWNEIKKIKRAYERDRALGKVETISFYSVGDNIDEFYAEAFTQAKMVEMGLDLPDTYGKKSIYSDEVLKAVNKYFKKKKRNKIF